MKTDPLLLKITGRDELGRVRTLEVVYDHETVNVADPANREFLVVHIERGILKHVNSRPAFSKPGGN